MENNFQKAKEWLWGRPLSPLTQSQLDNIPSTSKAAALTASASASSSINGSKNCQRPVNLLQLSSSVILKEPGFSGWSKPKGSASKRPVSIRVDPDYNAKARLGAAPWGMLTRGQLKKDQARLLDGTSAKNGPKDQKIVSFRRFRTGQKLMPTVWHSGNVCHHALRQICNPDTRLSAGNDVERWRAIESICLDLRGIKVSGNVGVLNGPVTFEDVFQVLGLDEQGELQVDPAPSPEINVELPGQEIEVTFTSESFDIGTYLMPPLDPIPRCPGREASGRALKRESKAVTKSPRRGEKRTTKSVYKRR